MGLFVMLILKFLSAQTSWTAKSRIANAERIVVQMRTGRGVTRTVKFCLEESKIETYT